MTTEETSKETPKNIQETLSSQQQCASSPPSIPKAPHDPLTGAINPEPSANETQNTDTEDKGPSIKPTGPGTS